MQYQMAIATIVHGNLSGQSGLTTKAVSEAMVGAAKTGTDADAGMATPGSQKSVSDTLAACINDGTSPSIRVMAACLMNVKPEKEQWRNIAQDWYGAGLAGNLAQANCIII